MGLQRDKPDHGLGLLWTGLGLLTHNIEVCALRLGFLAHPYKTLAVYIPRTSSTEYSGRLGDRITKTTKF